MTKIECSIVLGLLIVAVKSASLHTRNVNIPVRVVYDRVNLNLASARNVDQQPILSPSPVNKDDQPKPAAGQEIGKVEEAPIGCKDKNHNKADNNLSEKIQLSTDELQQIGKLVSQGKFAIKIVTPEENSTNNEEKQPQQQENQQSNFVLEARRLIEIGINRIKNDIKGYESLKIDDSKWRALNATLESDIKMLSERISTKQDAPAPAPPAPNPWDNFFQNFQATTSEFMQGMQTQWQSIQQQAQQGLAQLGGGSNNGASDTIQETATTPKPPNFIQIVQSGFQNLQQQLQNLQQQFAGAINNNSSQATVLGDVDLDEKPAGPAQAAQNFFNQVGNVVQNLNPFRPTPASTTLGDASISSPSPIVSAFQGATNQIQNFFTGGQSGQSSSTPSPPVEAPLEVAAEPLGLPPPPAPIADGPSRLQENEAKNSTLTSTPAPSDTKGQKEETMIVSE